MVDRQTKSGGIHRLAVFSDDEQYRYKLIVGWGGNSQWVNFIMLNPSTADEVVNDPTVERCQRRAKEWGYSGFIVTNIFALRSTDPKKLYSTPDPIGPANDEAIVESAMSTDLVVCGWGGHGKFMGRGDYVRAMLAAMHIAPTALRVTKSGQPGHPLYIPYSAKPIPYQLEVSV
jgi:hypothetical protein